jgi:hypothetical protein
VLVNKVASQVQCKKRVAWEFLSQVFSSALSRWLDTVALVSGHSFDGVKHAKFQVQTIARGEFVLRFHFLIGGILNLRAAIPNCQVSR